MFSPARAGVARSLGRGRRVDSVIDGSIEVGAENIFAGNPSNKNLIHHLSNTSLFQDLWETGRRVLF